MDARTVKERVEFFFRQAQKALDQAKAVSDLKEREVFLHIAQAWLDLATETQYLEEKTRLN